MLSEIAVVGTRWYHQRQSALQPATAEWVRRKHADPKFHATFAPFLDTLPPPEDVLTPEMWTPEMMEMAQSDELVRRMCLQT